MKKIIIGLLFLSVIQVGYAQAITTFILVRHAEKSTEGGSDPELKPEGVTRAESIVIAGHSNTIPEIANALVGEKKFEQFADDDYGNILIISVHQVGKDAKVVWLRF